MCRSLLKSMAKYRGLVWIRILHYILVIKKKKDTSIIRQKISVIAYPINLYMSSYHIMQRPSQKEKKSNTNCLFIILLVWKIDANKLRCVVLQLACSTWRNSWLKTCQKLLIQGRKKNSACKRLNCEYICK